MCTCLTSPRAKMHRIFSSSTSAEHPFAFPTLSPQSKHWRHSAPSNFKCYELLGRREQRPCLRTTEHRPEYRLQTQTRCGRRTVATHANGSNTCAERMELVFRGCSRVSCYALGPRRDVHKRSVCAIPIRAMHGLRLHPFERSTELQTQHELTG